MVFMQNVVKTLDRLKQSARLFRPVGSAALKARRSYVCSVGVLVRGAHTTEIRTKA